MRPSEEVANELEELRGLLVQLLNRKDALLVIDIEYIASNISDLKREYRIAKANEI